MKEEFIYRDAETHLKPFLHLRDMFAIPFNHWQKDNEWMVLVLLNGKAMHHWVEANSPQDAVAVALEGCIDLFFE